MWAKRFEPSDAKPLVGLWSRMHRPGKLTEVALLRGPALEERVSHCPALGSRAKQRRRMKGWMLLEVDSPFSSRLLLFGAFCVDVSTSACCQLMGFPLNHQKLNL